MDEIDRILQGSHESSAKMRSEVLTQMDGAGMDQGERVMVLGGALQRPSLRYVYGDFALKQRY